MNNKDSRLWILIALIAVVILLFSGSGMMGFGLGFGMGIGAIIMVLFWGAIIWLVISLIKNAGTKKPEETPESALTILKKRYAKGEITKEQYLEMEKELME